VERPRPLTKREVEALLVAVAAHGHADGPDLGDGGAEVAGDVAAEVAALVDALHAPLARAVGAPASLSWPALVERAATLGGWDDARVAAVRAIAGDGVARAALWDLVAELNELRGLERPSD
jgi:hypothetical protein